MWTFLAPWVSSITVTGLVIVLGYAYRDFFLKWLYRRVEHQFSEKMERLKSDLRVSEQEIQARFAASQKQIETLYGTTLALSSGRQSAIDKRRLEAIERVWNSAMSLSKASGAMKILQPLNFEEVLKAGPADRAKFGQMYEMLDEAVGASKLLETRELMLAREERPFVSSSVWAYYAAFHSLVIHGVLVVALLRKKMLDPTYFKFDAIRGVMKEVLPHHADGIDQHGVTYCYMCADELLEALLRAVQHDLDGKQQDAADIARANEIMEAVKKATAVTDDVRVQAEKSARAKS